MVWAARVRSVDRTRSPPGLSAQRNSVQSPKPVTPITASLQRHRFGGGTRGRDRCCTFSLWKVYHEGHGTSHFHRHYRGHSSSMRPIVPRSLTAPSQVLMSHFGLETVLNPLSAQVVLGQVDGLHWPVCRFMYKMWAALLTRRSQTRRDPAARSALSRSKREARSGGSAGCAQVGALARMPLGRGHVRCCLANWSSRCSEVGVRRRAPDGWTSSSGLTAKRAACGKDNGSSPCRLYGRVD